MKGREIAETMVDGLVDITARKVLTAVYNLLDDVDGNGDGVEVKAECKSIIIGLQFLDKDKLLQIIGD